MLNVSFMLAVIGLYLGALAWVGWRADRAFLPARAKTVRYGLSLATLCSAWTYFGAVGDAARGSWLFLANAIGPVLAVTLFAPVWRRIAVLAKQENVGSLADFLAARYGKNRQLGIVVTLIATLGTLPYIALQLVVLTQGWAFAVGGAQTGPVGTLVLVMVLTGMALAFGTRRPSLTQHNRGFVAIIAVEALVKISGLLLVAGLCWVLLGRGDHPWAGVWAAVPPLADTSPSTFVILTLLCTVTAFTLPRQFHLGFVALEKPKDMRGASLVVAGYFGLWVVATMVIAVGIRAGHGMAGVSPYLQVLAIPLMRGHMALATVAWLGGLSAGGAMVVVEMTAISAMVSNEIILPLFAGTMRERGKRGDVGRAIVRLRRITMIAIAALAWGYTIAFARAAGPTELGMTALTVFAQLVPALFGGIYWRRGHASGALAGLGAGVVIWAAVSAGPVMLGHAGAIWPATRGPWGEAAILLSLLANAAAYVLVSARARPSLIDLIQANNFVEAPDALADQGRREIGATLGDLRQLLRQFLGEIEGDRTLAEIASQLRMVSMEDAQPVSPPMVRQAERVLAGVIGASSARNVVAIALAAGGRDAGEVNRILDEAGHAVHFSRELLQTTLASLPQGVCVVDAGGMIVAWNAGYPQFLGLPGESIHVGQPLDDLLAMAPLAEAARAHRVWRQAQAKAQPLAEEIALGNGRAFSLRGRALAGGDYLMTLADITDLKRAEQVLAQNQEVLEQRVAERTRALTAANAALEEARARAEQVSGSQRRFVAAASHDLVQPLHAARLFIGNALLAADADQRDLLERADQSVEGAHRLLQAMLKLSQLELGALHPQHQPVDAGALLASLAAEFESMARARGLDLVVIPTARWVRTDRDLLRSILQNLLVNALRYTPRGRVVMCARRAADGLRFEVRDSGVGLAAEQLPAAFREFTRLEQGQTLSEGAGLGLSIVARIAAALGHRLAVASRPGVGSTFSITVPLCAPQRVRVPVRAVPVALGGLAVLCVEDDEEVLAGTAALIERWGGVVTRCNRVADVPPEGRWDAVLADYQLGDGDGFSLLRALAPRAGLRILITATPREDWAEALPRAGIHLLCKPMPPLELQRLLMEARANPAPG